MPCCKSHPTTDLIGIEGFLPSKYGRSGTLIIFLLLVPRVIRREALAAVPVMSIKTAKLHGLWRDLLKPSGYCYGPPCRTLRKLFILTAGCVYVFCLFLLQKNDYLLIEVRTLYINYFTIPTSVQDF